MSCIGCKAKWLGILDDMINHERTEAVSATMERSMAEHLSEWAEDNGLPAFHDGEAFKAWLDRCFLLRSCFEGGEPVQFGDRYVQHATNRLDTVSSITYSQGDGLHVRINGGGRCDASQRYRKELPVLDADGAPIEVGDTVWDTVSGIGGVVDNFQSIYGHDTTANIECPDDGKFYNFNVDRLTHKEPDTQERIDAEALLYYTEYWRCGGIDCDKCPAVDEDGKRPNKRYGTFGSCTKAMLLDLLRRQRELDARKGGE